MALFSRRPRRQVGIDIGTSSIKVVDLSREGSHPRLLNYGIMEGLDFFGDISPAANVPSKLKMSEDDIVTVLNKVFDFSKIKTKDAVFSIPIFSSFLTVMELPFMNMKELKRAVSFQARSYIPVPLSEVVLDWLAIPPRLQLKPLAKKKVNFKAQQDYAVSSSSPVTVTPAKPSLESTQKSAVLPDSSFGNQQKLTRTGVTIKEPPRPPLSNVYQQDAIKEPNLAGGKQTPLEAVPLTEPKRETKVDIPTKPEKISILLVAVPKEVINKYQRVVAKAKLNLRAFEPESFSLVRSMVGNDLNPTMLVDFGARSTTLTIIDQGFVKMSHSVDLSGKEISKVIARGLNISFSRADELKKTAGIASLGVERGIADLIKPLINKLVVEFEKMANIYMRKEGVKIKKVILAGGSASLPGLVSYLTSKLLTETVIGDPFARVSYPPELEKILKREIAPSLSVAVGLAMRDF